MATRARQTVCRQTDLDRTDRLDVRGRQCVLFAAGDVETFKAYAKANGLQVERIGTGLLLTRAVTQ